MERAACPQNASVFSLGSHIWYGKVFSGDVFWIVLSAIQWTFFYSTKVIIRKLLHFTLKLELIVVLKGHEIP